MAVFPLSLSQWKYRKAFQITEQAGQNLTDYQKLIKIGESSGATGCDFHLEGLSAIFPSGQNQSGDLRFHDGQNELNFWVENVTGTSPNRIAYVWVKIPSLSANQTKTLYCYFGNPNATNASNGVNTFQFFDDFESYADGSDINNQGGWRTIRVGGTGEAKVRLVNGRNHLHLVSTLYVTSVDHLMSISNAGYAMRIYEFADDWDDALFMDFTDGTYDSGGGINNGYEAIWTGGGGTVSQIRKRVNNAITVLASISDSDANNVYHILEFTWLGSSLKAFRDNELKMSATDTTFSSRTYIYLGTWQGTSRYIDWVLVRKYVSPEPAFSSAGSLEKRSSIIPLIL